MTLEQIIEFLEHEVKCCERWQRQNSTLWEFYKGKIDGLQMALDNLKTIKEAPDQNIILSQRTWKNLGSDIRNVIREIEENS